MAKQVKENMLIEPDWIGVKIKFQAEGLRFGTAYLDNLVLFSLTGMQT
jgi:hypothetical protein